jgi:pimeloyl-ACP methyl ester carboxylesterase
MIPDAFATRGDYADLKMPLVIISGDQDRLVDIEDQSARLHEAVAQSSLSLSQIPSAWREGPNRVMNARCGTCST